MIASIEQFKDYWKSQSDATRKMMGALTDASLGEVVAEGHRTLGRIAWHIVQSIPEMANKTGLVVDGPSETENVPQTADQLRTAYDRTASSLLEQVAANWNDDALLLEDDMYGERWKRGFTLKVLMDHEIHHRGQMSVLMRGAGLRVPGVYGPSKEEWAQYGMKDPEI
jgi:uncharacterized damage-inducible protein DinB